LNGTVAFLLPLDAQGKGRKRHFSPALLVPSFSKTTKKTPTQNTLLTLVLTRGLSRGKAKQRGCTLWAVVGRLHSSRPCLSPPYILPINTKGESTKEEDKKERVERSRERKKKEDPKRKKGRKNKRRKKKNRKRNRGRQGEETVYHHR